MRRLIDTVRNIWRIEELRKRILFTLGVLVVCRLGAHITLPGIDVVQLSANLLNKDADGGLFNLLNTFVGGAFNNAAIFALGIMPYISSSIIFQIAGAFVPQIQKLQREGEDGRRKLNQYTRQLTIIIAGLQGLALATKIIQDGVVMIDPTLFTISTCIIISAGTVFLMWLGEQITERGIGNGISLIIFFGIVARLPESLMQEYSLLVSGERSPLGDIILLGIWVLMIAFIVWITQGARIIPVQYAKRIVGRKVMGGTMSKIPLRVNTAGVMPIIFAQTILFFPSMIAGFFPDQNWLQSLANTVSGEQSWVYAIIYGSMIVFFSYFYTAIAFNPREVADNMKKQGGFIPGVRPGSPTAEYIDNILTRITLPGAIFIAIIAMFPTFLINVMQTPAQFASFFGGTSLLIIVGVALDTLQQIESYLLMRHYDGFMKSGKIRGRANASVSGGSF